jgi:hypothetical protein
MDTSEAMLRKHYGHLLPDTDALVVERLNAYAATGHRRDDRAELGEAIRAVEVRELDYDALLTSP